MGGPPTWTHDQVGLKPAADLPQLTHHLLPGLRIPEQGHHAAKQDAGLGKIRDIADGVRDFCRRDGGIIHLSF